MSQTNSDKAKSCLIRIPAAPSLLPGCAHDCLPGNSNSLPILNVTSSRWVMAAGLSKPLQHWPKFCIHFSFSLPLSIKGRYYWFNYLFLFLIYQVWLISVLDSFKELDFVHFLYALFWSHYQLSSFPQKENVLYFILLYNKIIFLYIIKIYNNFLYIIKLYFIFVYDKIIFIFIYNKIIFYYKNKI